jgi:hypothetical protein
VEWQIWHGTKEKKEKKKKKKEGQARLITVDACF